MDVSIFSRNMEMTSRLQDYVEQKVERLDRYLPWIDEARVDLAVENTRNAAHSQVAQLTVRVRGTILRAEERTQDMFASIDAVLDKERNADNPENRLKILQTETLPTLAEKVPSLSLFSAAFFHAKSERLKGEYYYPNGPVDLSKAQLV